MGPSVAASIHARKMFNTSADRLCTRPLGDSQNAPMAREQPTFKDLVEAGARARRDLWKSDGQLNLGALSRATKVAGAYLSEASLSRILRNEQEVGPKAVEAMHRLLGIPRALLRGEPMDSDVERLLTEYKLSTLLLAQKIERLPKDEYYALAEQVERVLEREQRLKEAIRSGNVTPIERAKR